MKNRSVSNSTRLKEIKKKKRVYLRRKISIVFVGVIVLFGGLAYLSSLPKINIQNIKIVGNKVIDSMPVESLIKSNLEGKYLWMFPKTNSIIYPREKIEKDLINNFQRMKDISFSLKDLNTLEVSFKEREAEYIWCGVNLPEGEVTDELKCYFMDDTGYLFDESPFFSGEVYFRFFGPVDNVDSPKGANFVSGEFENLVIFKESLKKLDVKPVAIFLKDDKDIEVILSSSLSLREAPKIIFKSDSDLNKMVENLQSALTAEPLRDDFKNKYNSLKYIDLRFGNKVYYKFND
ncbi:MAG: cell division protein FtsQ [Patescibacteria group bacterium]|nr:cell division protein FtsQ [Patescibacteria group bacterium]